jgi:hypothetical protein
MSSHLLTEHSSAENSPMALAVTRKVLRERAVEIAGMVGREPQAASKSDWEQSKHELLDEPSMDNEAESMPCSVDLPDDFRLEGHAHLQETILLS